MEIILHNNKSRVIADKQILHKLCNLSKLRAKNYFWSPQYRSGRWDGYVKYLSEDTGSFMTGLLPYFLKLIKEQYGVVPKVRDTRSLFSQVKKIDALGNLALRNYQASSATSLLNNHIQKIRFQRGILHEATNGGKNLIAATIIASYSKKRQGIFLINNLEIYNQAVEELRELLGKDLVGEVSSKKTDIKRLTVCMVQSLSNRIQKDPKVKAWAQGIDIMIVDEADDVMGRKDAKFVLTQCHNSTVRVALTGTANISPDPNKNRLVEGYFGSILHTTTNLDLVNAGYSAKPIITIVDGNREITSPNDYDNEYQQGIIENKKRHKRIWNRVQTHIDKNRLPITILFKYHQHGQNLLKTCPKQIQQTFKIGLVHHNTKNRAYVIQDFKDGKIDILLCSMIIRRGKNLPTIKALLNTAGGDMESNVLQILGRALRKTKGKNKVWFDDFYDQGKYLRRHSKHRIIWLKKQGFPVKEKYTK